MVIVRKWLIVAAASCLPLLPHSANARDQIEIVGSSTVYPFTAAVVEKVKSQGIAVELKSTGTRAGFNAFCLGYGDWWPDVTGASRPIKDSETGTCADRGVEEITEVKIGYDGMVVAHSTAGAKFGVSRKDLYLALAERLLVDGELVANDKDTWKSVNDRLPDLPIEVYGPPGSSGTRDSFESLAVSAGCKAANADSPVPEDLSDLDYCKDMRAAPQFVEAGEDDAQIVQVLKEKPDAFGIFGYSYAVANPTEIEAIAIDGVAPSPETIGDGSYPLSRPLFLYVKNSRLAEVPKLRAFLEEYVSDAAIGPDGYLAQIGLVPLPPEELAATRAAVEKLLKGGAATN